MGLISSLLSTHDTSNPMSGPSCCEDADEKSEVDSPGE